MPTPPSTLLPALGVGPYRLLFVFSGVARASCAYWALHLDEEPSLAPSATRSHA